MPKKLDKASFDPHLKTTFEIQPPDEDKVKVKLVEVEDLSRDNMEAFSVIFKGPVEDPLYQGNYKVKHAKMGTIELFIVPIVHPKTDGTYYQSVFNRLIEEEKEKKTTKKKK